MSQCVGRSQRTGERCKRSAVGDSTTCSYHAAGATKVAAPGRRTLDPATLTVQPLSVRTCDDFETLFAEGTGWGRCACLFALDARRVTRGGTWAEQRVANLRTMRTLVEEGRSHGVLVHDGHEPVGWCQVAARQDLRHQHVAASGADWYVTCFVVAPSARGNGVSSVALGGALDLIADHGGGVVEGHGTAMVPGPAPTSDRKDFHVADDVLFWGGRGRARYGFEVDGVGPVVALYGSKRAMHNAPLGGTVDLYRGAGFDAVAVVPRPKNAIADRIVMRRTV